ncbi:MAG TPA: BMP family ABC transporter substrate-binding protein [Polyangia bacterium]|jgi:basic membrane protein A|nr:BMP family ABC transporter substrate-binding protein [Polyangia bacterium]
MRRFVVFTALLVLLDVALIGARAGRARVAGDDKAIRVGVVFDVGGRGDKSFNDSAYRGLDRAVRELGVHAEYIEPGEGSDRESGIRLLAAKGFDLIIGVGFIFSDDLYAMAGEYPRTRFACPDYAKFDAHGFVVPPANMVALKFREEEGSFLVGALAALVSKTHAVGFVGGMDIPLIHKFEAGYRAGAKYVCPECRVFVGYAGVTGDAFKNPAKGKELALSQYGNGADVIFHAAGTTGLGVFEAARETNNYAIGVDADQWNEAPGRVLTSMTKELDVAVYETVERVRDGHWRGGVVQLGLREKGVDYVYDAHNRALIGDAVHARVEQLRADIIAGKIQVPDR